MPTIQSVKRTVTTTELIGRGIVNRWATTSVVGTCDPFTVTLRGVEYLVSNWDAEQHGEFRWSVTFIGVRVLKDGSLSSAKPRKILAHSFDDEARFHATEIVEQLEADLEVTR